MKIVTLSIIFLLLRGNAGAQQPAQTMPSFTFFTLDQKPFTEKNLSPKKLLFFIFFDPGCEHCQRTITYINLHYKSLLKAAVTMVSMDKPDKIMQFMNTYAPQLKVQKNVTVLQDKNYVFITKFKPKKYPAMFLYTSQKHLLDYDDSETSVDRFLNRIIKTPG